jgi:AAA+ ATPase superfamily predicted ATPase
MMLFLDRQRELASLATVTDRDGGLAIVWGRRRIGKTRLLLEWCRRARGVYVVADQSSTETQRAYVARSLAETLPGLADVTYPDWERLLARVAADASARAFRGPSSSTSCRISSRRRPDCRACTSAGWITTRSAPGCPLRSPAPVSG